MPPVSEFESPKLYIAGKAQEGDDEYLSSTHFTQDRKNTTNSTLNLIFKVGSAVLLS